MFRYQVEFGVGHVQLEDDLTAKGCCYEEIPLSIDVQSILNIILEPLVKSWNLCIDISYIFLYLEISLISSNFTNKKITSACYKMGK